MDFKYQYFRIFDSISQKKYLLQILALFPNTSKMFKQFQ